MKEDFLKRLPYLEEIQVSNNPMPLYFSHWVLPHTKGFNIRQKISNEIENGGLNLILTQYDNTRRGVESLKGSINYKDFIRPEGLVGVKEWLARLQAIINSEIVGADPLEKIRLCQTRQGALAYYGYFYSKLMELVLYIGFGEDIDGASIEKRDRSKLIEETREWSIILEQLPETIWIEEVSK